ncbi:hypothetical protein [Pararhodospirillum oryzae]|nr:hypothetical protein [Pararhodospirillum oryzae]
MRKVFFGATIVMVTLIASCASRKDSLNEIGNQSIDRVRIIASQNADFIRKNGDKELSGRSVQYVKDTMKDPDSALVRNVKVVDFEGGKVVCGEVNAKNSYGAYVGYSAFAASPKGAEFYQKDTSRFPSAIFEAQWNLGIIKVCSF